MNDTRARLAPKYFYVLMIAIVCFILLGTLVSDYCNSVWSTHKLQKAAKDGTPFQCGKDVFYQNVSESELPKAHAELLKKFGKVTTDEVMPFDRGNDCRYYWASNDVYATWAELNRINVHSGYFFAFQPRAPD